MLRWMSRGLEARAYGRQRGSTRRQMPGPHEEATTSHSAASRTPPIVVGGAVIIADWKLRLINYLSLDSTLTAWAVSATSQATRTSACPWRAKGGRDGGCALSTGEAGVRRCIAGDPLVTRPRGFCARM